MPRAHQMGLGAGNSASDGNLPSAFHTETTIGGNSKLECHLGTAELLVCQVGSQPALRVCVEQPFFHFDPC